MRKINILFALTNFIIKFWEAIKSLFICAVASLIVGLIHALVNSENDCFFRIFCDDIYFGVVSLFISDIILKLIKVKTIKLTKIEIFQCVLSIVGFITSIAYYVALNVFFFGKNCSYEQLVLLMCLWMLSSGCYFIFKTVTKK